MTEQHKLRTLFDEAVTANPTARQGNILLGCHLDVPVRVDTYSGRGFLAPVYDPNEVIQVTPTSTHSQSYRLRVYAPR